MVTDLPLATEERLENAALVAAGYRVIEVETDELLDKVQLPFPLDELPPTFSKFRKAVEKKPALNPLMPFGIPKLPPIPKQPWSKPSQWLKQSEIKSLDAQSLLIGGRKAGLAYWHGYLEAGALSHYKETRNAFEGLYQSSYLSSWLAHGCLSVCEIWADVLTYEQQQGANESTYWLRFELLWREFFIGIAESRIGPCSVRLGLKYVMWLVISARSVSNFCSASLPWEQRGIDYSWI